MLRQYPDSREQEVHFERTTVGPPLGFFHDDDSLDDCSSCSTYIDDDCSEAAEPTFSSSLIEVRNLIAFAKWAFGPRGFPHLRILAYGDFSYDGRYSQQQILLSRAHCSPPINSGLEKSYYQAQIQQAPPFRLLTVSDLQAREDLGIDRQFLECCPVDNLLDSPIEL